MSLIFAEVTTTAMSKQRKPQTFNENKQVAREGGQVAKNARTDIKNRLGTNITPLNASNKNLLEIDLDNTDDEE